MQDNQHPNAGDAPEDGSAERSRRTAAEIVADLERERDEKIEKIRKDYNVKIAKAKRNATPIGERRRAALDFLDRLRDAYRAAHGDILLEESVVDGEISNMLVASLDRSVGGTPAFESAMQILNGKGDDEGAAADGAPAGDAPAAAAGASDADQPAAAGQSAVDAQPAPDPATQPTGASEDPLAAGDDALASTKPDAPAGDVDAANDADAAGKAGGEEQGGGIALVA